MDPNDPEDAAALAAQKAAAAAEAQRLFDRFDADNSGSLDRNEVRLLLESQGVCVTPQYLAGLIDAFDTDGDGTFDRDEFSRLAQVVISRSVPALGNAFCLSLSLSLSLSLARALCLCVSCWLCATYVLAGAGRRTERCGVDVVLARPEVSLSRRYHGR